MTRRDADNLVECPDCSGQGTLSTPSKNPLHRKEVCDLCRGTGYIDKDLLECRQRWSK